MAENYIDKIEVDGVERPIRDTSGSVRYDAAQTLSDEQKAQARTNVNAAPGGFGLGQENMVAINDCNNAVLSGWYTTDNITANTPAEDTNSGVLCVSRRYDNRIYQEFHAISGGQYSAGTASRISYGDNHTAPQWGPWEWANPPMQLGVEYRTTERHLGEPVYVQVVDFGQLPNNSTIGKYIPNMDNVDKTIRWFGLTSNGYSLPGGNLYASWAEIAVRIVGNRIDVKTTTDESAYTATFTLWYTKTSD